MSSTDDSKARKAAEASAAATADKVPGAKEVMRNAEAPAAQTYTSATDVLNATYVPGPGQFPVEASRAADDLGTVKATPRPAEAPKGKAATKDPETPPAQTGGGSGDQGGSGSGS